MLNVKITERYVSIRCNDNCGRYTKDEIRQLKELRVFFVPDDHRAYLFEFTLNGLRVRYLLEDDGHLYWEYGMFDDYVGYDVLLKLLSNRETNVR